MSFIELRHENNDSFYFGQGYEQLDASKKNQLDAQKKLTYLANASNWNGKEWDSDLDLVAKKTNTLNIFQILASWFYSSANFEEYDFKTSKSTLENSVKKNIETVNHLYMLAYPSFQSEKEFQDYGTLQRKVLANINNYIIKESIQIPTYVLAPTIVEDEAEETDDNFPIEYNDGYDDDSSNEEKISVNESLTGANKSSSFNTTPTASHYNTRLRSSIPSRTTENYYKKLSNSEITPFKYR